MQTRTSSKGDTGSLLSILMLPVMVAGAITLDCEHIKVKGKSFDLTPLAGPHQVKYSEDVGQSVREGTYTIDLCTALSKVKGVPAEEQCPSGTRICGIERTTSKIDNGTIIDAVRAIAGEIGDYGGSSKGLDPSWTLLSESESHSDAGKEGIRLVLNGGKWPLTGKDKKDQQAIIELVCDKDRTGLEGDIAPEDNGSLVEKEETPASNASLTFVSYPGSNVKIDILRLDWRTKYACEDSKGETDARKNHWGFFTWFILIAFLGTAAYLIFGSWLNYTRYGARGWDLLPHGDTIRDVPYLVKDWTRKVVTTVQGGGSRGGYAAV